MSAADVTLLVNGARYGGWTSATITRAMETASGGFDLTLTSRWSGQDVDFPLAPGDCCELAIAGSTVITGWLDWVVVREDAESREITVSGRDAAGDLVDCSAANQPGEWRGLTLREIVQQIASPFGVRVRSAIDAGERFPVFRLELGESAWEAIERACRFRQALCMSDGRGALILVRAGQGRADVRLDRGVNIIEFGCDFDDVARYSEIIVLGQRPAADGEDLALAFHGRAHLVDKGIRRYRPLILLAEDQATQADLDRRAEWEGAVRFGRSRKLTAKVQGWRQKPNTRLWQPNERVRVTSNRVPTLDEDMLIVACEYRMPPETTILTLMPPEAFAPAPPPAKDLI